MRATRAADLLARALLTHKGTGQRFGGTTIGFGYDFLAHGGIPSSSSERRALSLRATEGAGFVDKA